MIRNNEKSLLKDKNFHILNIVSFISIISNVLNPAFRVIADEFHITPDQIGLLTTGYSIPMVILSPIVGVAADRFGRKKVLGLSLLIFGFSSILSVMSRSYEALFISEVIRGVGLPGIVTVSIVLIGDFYTKSRRNQVMGINSAVMNVGFAILPIVGGILAGISWYYPYALFITAVPVAFIVFFALDEPAVVKKQEKILPYIKETFTYYKNSRVIVLSIASFLVYSLLSGCYLVYVPFLFDDPSWIGIVFSVMSIASCGPAIVLEKLIARIGEEGLVKVVFICFITAFYIGTRTNSVFTAIIFSLVFGIGIGIIMPLQNIMLLPLSGEGVRGTFISIQNLIHSLGEVVGPVIFGLIFIRSGIKGTFYVAAVISVIALMFVSVCLIKPKMNN